MKPGTVVAGRYRCAQLLGRGGMGAVHAAIDLRTDRRVALKLMHGHRLDSADARARFEREARVGARIDSPYLVDVLDAGVDADSGTPFLVMELLDGQDLEQRLAALGPRPADEVVAHLGQVALALGHMRAERVVHRDLKPSNLFLQERRDEPARIKVLDLGVAKELAESGGQTTGLAGTPVYMAPEQISAGAISPATDRYALGLIAFTLLAGAPYWAKRPDDDPIALAVKMKDGPQAPASARAAELGATLPAGFDAWFAQATARRADRRFGSAIAAVRALAAALGVAPPPWLPDDDEPPPPIGDDATDDGGAARPEGSPTVTAARSPGAASTVLAGPSVSDETPAPPPARRRAARGAAVIVAGGAAIATWLAWPASRRAPSPLADRGAILACPVLEVDGDVAERGWLGAAGAAIACERGRVVLGGLPSRTLVPAELLDLPRQPQDDVPADPFGAADARARTVLAAQRRAAAYLDGRIAQLGARFQLELVLRRADGTELARATGDGVAVAQAVIAAMAPLIASGAIPAALVPEVAIADDAGGGDVASLLDFLDLHLAFKNNAGQVDDACARVARAHPGAGDRAAFARYECAFTFGEPAPAVPATDPPATPGAEAMRARVVHMVRRHDDPAAIARLEARYRAAPSAWTRSSLAATLSCLLQDRADGRAVEWAQRAIQHEPKNPTGEWCAPWDQLATLDPRTAVMRSMQAWEPWHPYAWTYDPVEAERGLLYARRAYTLSPLDTDIAATYAERLIAKHRLDDAYTIAVAIAGGGHPVHAVESELLHVRIAAAKARFREALARAQKAMRSQPGDAGWTRTQRVAIASNALAIAIVIGQAREVADLAVTELVAPEPPPIDGVFVGEPRRLATICAYASIDRARRCFARLDALLPTVAGAALASTTAYAAGARRYAEGDLRGAAEAWRPLIAADDYGALAEAMVVAFAAAGEPAVVARIVARGGDDFHGASMVMVRAAQAAHARGDRAEAARLAAAVIAAWSVADVKPPILDELRALVP